MALYRVANMTHLFNLLSKFALTLVVREKLIFYEAIIHIAKGRFEIAKNGYDFFCFFFCLCCIFLDTTEHAGIGFWHPNNTKMYKMKIVHAYTDLINTIV